MRNWNGKRRYQVSETCANVAKTPTGDNSIHVQKEQKTMATMPVNTDALRDLAQRFLNLGEALRNSIHPSMSQVTLLQDTWVGMAAEKFYSELYFHWTHKLVEMSTECEYIGPYLLRMAAAIEGADQVEVLHALQTVGSEEAIFSPTIARRLIQYFAQLKQGVLPVFPELTDREREVLTLLAQGKTNVAIAEKLILSPKTVRNHVSTIFSKLQVANRAEALLRAREAGLG
jgi:WXG100 family type VII secretion target